VWALLSGFVGGIIAWIVTTAIGQPLQRFFQLRQQAALVLAEYDDRLWINNPEAEPPSNDRFKERSEAFDKVGSELVAFADSNTFVARSLACPMAKTEKSHFKISFARPQANHYT
jgi:hypothetical protein